MTVNVKLHNIPCCSLIKFYSQGKKIIGEFDALQKSRHYVSKKFYFTFGPKLEGTDSLAVATLFNDIHVSLSPELKMHCSH